MIVLMENVHCAESGEFLFIYKETKYNKHQSFS